MIRPKFILSYQSFWSFSVFLFFLFKFSLEKKVNWETPAKFFFFFPFLFLLLNYQLPSLSDFFIRYAQDTGQLWLSLELAVVKWNYREWFKPTCILWSLLITHSSLWDIKTSWRISLLERITMLEDLCHISVIKLFPPKMLSVNNL